MKANPLSNTEKFRLWDTCELRRFNKNTVLVRSNSTGLLMIRKNMDITLLPLLETLVHVSSPHIARVYDVCVLEGHCVALLEYVEGLTLEEMVTDNPFPPDVASEYMLQLCDGLRTLHCNGIIHRDITPSNVIVSASGSLKIIDFGIARTQKNGATSDTSILGTAGYAAPEQFGFSQSRERCDLYAAGILFNYLMTGHLPPEQLADNAFTHIIRKCTMLDPAARYPSARALAQAIRATAKTSIGLQRLRRLVPGFRSGNAVAAACAVFFYCTAILADIILPCLWLPENKWQALCLFGQLQLLIALPFVLYTDFIDWTLRLWHIKQWSQKKRRLLRILTGTVALCAGLWALSGITTP